MIRRLSTPRTRSDGVDHVVVVRVPSRRCRWRGTRSIRGRGSPRSRRRPPRRPRPGRSPVAIRPATGSWAKISRILRKMRTPVSRSCSVVKKLLSISSGASGSAAGDVHGALTVGAQHVADALHPRLAFQPDRLAGHRRLGGPRGHQDLCVDAVEVGTGLHESDDVVGRRREGAALGREVLDAAHRLRERAAQLAVVPDVLAEPELEHEAVVLAHARADVRAVEADVDARGAQHLRRPDAGQLEELRASGCCRGRGSPRGLAGARRRPAPRRPARRPPCRPRRATRSPASRPRPSGWGASPPGAGTRQPR